MDNILYIYKLIKAIEDSMKLITARSISPEEPPEAQEAYKDALAILYHNLSSLLPGSDV